MPSFSFPKREKLKHKKLFAQLFEQGQSKYKFPIRMLWIKVDPPISNVPILCAVSVPKRLFPKAIQRNRIKRQLREAYRLNKPSCIDKNLDSQYALLFIFTSKEPVSFRKINNTMNQLTKFLHNQISQN